MARFEVNDALDHGCVVSINVADVAEVRAVTLFELQDGKVLFKRDRGGKEFHGSRITRYQNGHIYTTQTYDEVVKRWVNVE